jgi:hypothetical protein
MIRYWTEASEFFAGCVRTVRSRDFVFRREFAAI